ncbi:glycoside hydrolase [Stemphylium lycopersici]|uniref:Glycoside hydrolase n=1 Tax=Stemphylium lycopersici TaxID=183478 RepID=A0A364N5N7_STELY|nr:glycoside hydrolase [Stemphylium lycopersici]
MRYAFAPVVLGLGANALVARQNTQCFQLKASGDASGILGQLGDGQNRVGDDLPTGCYCLDNDGGFTDSNGRGCILTPPTTQFQCDAGATPTDGFAVGSNGDVTYNGDSTFYACPVNDQGVYNIYTTPAPGQDKCVKITLGSAGSCGAGTSQSEGKPGPTTVVTQTKTVATETNTITKTYPGQEQPPYPTGPPASKSNQPTGYPGKPSPSMPGKPEESMPGKPQESMPGKPEEPMPGKPMPSMTGPGVPEASECVPNVVTVTVTAPGEGIPSATAPGEGKPSGPAEGKPSATYPAEKPSATAPAEGEPSATMPAGNGGKYDSCPKDLNGNYQYPHLIVPIDSEHPDQSYGTSYNGQVSNHVCTIFNFDIPASYAGKKCSTIFLFPNKEDLETSDYTMTGSGTCTVSKLKGNANEQTTWANAPAKDHDVASVDLHAGGSWTVDEGDCPAGQRVSYEMCGSGDLDMEYFQDWNPSPIGMYIRQC